MHRLLSLLKQLSTAQLVKYATSPPGGNSIKDYIRNMIQTADEVAAIGYKLDRPVVIAFILNGLPETFRYLVVNLESQVDTISFQDLQARLLDEDKRIQERDDVENTSTALNARYKKPSEYFCGHCNKKGHSDEHCFKKPGNIRCRFCGRVGHNENVYRARIYHESKESKDKKNNSDDEPTGGLAIYSPGQFIGMLKQGEYEIFDLFNFGNTTPSRNFWKQRSKGSVGICRSLLRNITGCVGISYLSLIFVLRYIVGSPLFLVIHGSIFHNTNNPHFARSQSLTRTAP